MKTFITIPLEILPDAKDWKIGENYKVKMVLKQTELNSNTATFEIVDVNSLETSDKAKREFMLSSEGAYLGK